MKMLIVSALVCAMMVLTRAAAPSEETPQDEPKSHLVKTWTDCPDGWSFLGDHCYYYFSTHMSWTRAEKNCQALGGNLASVHNIQQHYDIQNLIFQITDKHDPTWIGGSDAEEESQWLWSDGSSFNYQRWCHGEPNNHGGNQHCMRMTDKKCWDDFQCSTKLPSVCVRKRR